MDAFPHIENDSLSYRTGRKTVEAVWNWHNVEWGQHHLQTPVHDATEMCG